MNKMMKLDKITRYYLKAVEEKNTGKLSYASKLFNQYAKRYRMDKEELKKVKTTKIKHLLNYGHVKSEFLIKEFQDKLIWIYISRHQTLSEAFIREFKDKVCWINISMHQKLSESFIREFKDKVDWGYIQRYQVLSKKFILNPPYCISWNSISWYQILSEDFIREFKDEVAWHLISDYQTLSEEFIREFAEELDWYYLSCNHNLSEDLIRDFQVYVDWWNISYYQTLSEDFIKEFKDKVVWNRISEHQVLSEKFIREFQDYVNWENISRYQTLSEDFIKEFHLFIPEDCWLYHTKEQKLKFIKKNTEYEVIDDEYIIAYKSVKQNYCSVFKNGFIYKKGKTFTSHCDCNIDDSNSFGLSAWTKEHALDYHRKGKTLKVKIKIEDIGCIVKKHYNKIRARKLTVIEEVK